MANADLPRGLVPVRYLSGAPYNGAINCYSVPASDATAIYVGGLVKFAGSADADGKPTVTGNVATGNPVLGVVVGFDIVGPTTTLHGAASTLRKVLVADDPNLLFEVQVQGVLTPTMIGNVAQLMGFTAGSTLTGWSGIEVNLATVTAAGLGAEDVLIWGMPNRPDNEIGADAKVYVRLNNHALVDGSPGA